MRKISFVLFVLICVLQLQSCKKEQTEQKTDTSEVAAKKRVMKKADSLLALVHKEWKVYTDLDSVKYKDLHGVYFQLRNLPTTDLKKMKALEDTTKAYEAKDIHLRTPNFINEFFAYDSLLMIHVKEVVAFSQDTKGAENLAVLQQLNKSLLDAVDDNLFVSMQSHLDLAIAYYNQYLIAHPEVSDVNPEHKPFPEFGSIDRKQLKPIL
ncbi:MAG TPA: hypothetical protein VL947_08545 [Cytophagales bacterium]|nr:hypothetical protein [Cytophagales bacterium]